MPLSLHHVHLLLYIFLGLIGGMLLLNLLQYPLGAVRNKRRKRMTDYICAGLPGDPPGPCRLLVEQYVDLRQRVQVSKKIREKLRRVLTKRKSQARFIRALTSVSAYRRCRGALYLGYTGSDEGAAALSKALRKEKRFTVRMYMVEALVELGRVESTPAILESLGGSSSAYIRRVATALGRSGTAAYGFVEQLIGSTVEEEQEFLLAYSVYHFTPQIRDFVLQIAGKNQGALSQQAARVLADHYHHLLDQEAFLQHPDPIIRGLAIRSLGRNPNLWNLSLLFRSLRNHEMMEDASIGLSDLLRREPRLHTKALELFKAEEDPETRRALVSVFSFRIEHFLSKLSGAEEAANWDIVTEMLRQRQTSAVIGFLNHNTNAELQASLLAIVNEVMREDDFVKLEMRTYLREDILQQLRLERPESPPKRKSAKKERQKTIILSTGLAISLLGFPLAFTFSNLSLVRDGHWRELVEHFIIQFNYILIFYSTSLNGVYILLLVLSAIGIVSQAKYWRLKKDSFLFRKDVLPSISLIAPAYNEETNIIESVNSLLNLRYPRYELIVVNDGSSDGTLNRLIDYYNLNKVDRKIDKALSTMPTRGLYANAQIPNLLVIDKANGGKADSLNAGINATGMEYICGIDADSLLESDALLKVAAVMLDTDTEMVAAGGNIFPINGCTVERGHLSKVRIPRSALARFQTVEYLRAFMTGRVGWDMLRSLLIISGAFGLFRRNRIIEIGGYLTEKSRYHKDTVGEDMELVVRLDRSLREQGIRHRIRYAFLANCWTEVPEKWKILHSQRDRWQRGLLDILVFHRKMIFNPRYGMTGLIALPYFTVFEAIGPLIEFQGYLMVGLAAALGLLNQKIVLLLFIASILMGVLVSLFALLASGMESPNFSFKERLILLLFAIIENFGYRQVQLLWRVQGYLNSLKRPKGWGEMERKGFSNENSAAKVSG